MFNQITRKASIPHPITELESIPSDLDAILLHTNDYVYIFKDGKHTKIKKIFFKENTFELVLKSRYCFMFVNTYASAKF